MILVMKWDKIAKKYIYIEVCMDWCIGLSNIYYSGTRKESKKVIKDELMK